MVDIHLILRISGITGVHDETGQVANTVNPEWVAVVVPRRRLKFHQGRGFVLVAVKDDFLNRLVVIVVLNECGEQLVHHTTLHAMSLASLGAFLEMLDAPLDEVFVALPFELRGAGVEEPDSAVGVIDYLLALWRDRPDLHLSALFGPFGCSRNSE